jgi:glycerol-3-phosphate cytidylyltransferase
MEDDKKIIGYTAGCYDMLHIGHLNIFKRAKEKCDFLVVGVNSDEAMFSYKNRYPVIPQDERLEIVSNIKQVDEAFIVENTDKKVAYEKVKYDVIFVGDDHKGEPKWVELEDYLASKGSKVMYLPYTTHTSSTGLREKLRNLGIDDV